MSVQDRVAWRQSAVRITTPPKIGSNGTRRMNMRQCFCLRWNRPSDLLCGACGRTLEALR